MGIEAKKDHSTIIEKGFVYRQWEAVLRGIKEIKKRLLGSNN